MQTPILTHARQRVTVGVHARVVQQLHQARFNGVAHDVLPAAGLVVNLRPLHTNHVEKQTLSQAVLAQHLGRAAAPLLGQLEAPIPHHVQQAVTLHAGDRLRHRRPRMAQAVHDAGTQGRHPILFQLENGLEIHLGGVDQVCHGILL